MRIALFSGNSNYLREGANQALNKLVGYLEQQAGHCVRVYSPVTETPDFEPVGTLVPVASVRLPVRGEFRLALGLPKAIRRDLDGFAPDLVHVATPEFYAPERKPMRSALEYRSSLACTHFSRRISTITASAGPAPLWRRICDDFIGGAAMFSPRHRHWWQI